jgi:hypothetical protein
MKKGTTYYIISRVNPAMILCPDNAYHWQGAIGPGTGRSAKIYKTRAGAERAAERWSGIVIEETK